MTNIKTAFNILTKIENEIKSGMSIGGKTLCNRAKILEMIDKLKKVLQEQEEQMIKKEHQLNLKVKEEIAKRIESEEYVMEMKRKAEAIIKEAQQEANAIREWANAYATKVLTTLEAELTKVLSKTREAKVKISESMNHQMKTAPSHQKVKTKASSKSDLITTKR